MILFHAAFAFLAGVALAAIGGAGVWPLLALGGAGVCLGTALAGRRQAALTLAFLCLLALLGLDRYQEALPPAQPGGIAVLNDRDEPIRLRGVIVSEPEEGDRAQRFTLRVDAADRGGGYEAAEGRVMITTRPYPAYKYGDILEVTALLQSPPVFESFDYRDYLARRGVRSQALFPAIRVIGEGEGSAANRLLIDARRPLGEALERALPEPESALARGILLGQRAAIPEDLTDDMNRAGISHLVAISGQNVAIVAGVLVASTAWLIGRRPATALAIVLIWVYALFVGGEPSVLRAAAMATLMLGATLAGRPGSALGAVTLAAAVLVAARPLIVEDVAFQLSFAATLGIILWAERIRALVEPRLFFTPASLAAPISETLAMTTAASLAVLPVIASSFGRVSLVSLPANLVAAPLFLLALGGACLTAVAGAIDGNAGLLAGEVAYLPLTGLVRLGRFAAGLPLASLEIERFGLAAAVATYAVIGAAALLLSKRLPAVVEVERYARPVSPVLAVTALVAVAAGFVWYEALQPQPDRLRVTVLDVGQGDAILIETPDGQHILVDGGPSGARIAQALGRALPPSQRYIDLLVLTHAQDDHVTGLVEVLQRFEVGAALAGSLAGETAAYRAWREALELEGVKLVTVTAGRRIEIGHGSRIEVLAPPSEPLADTRDDLNENSVVLRVVHGAVSFLLTGDLAAEGEAALLDASFDLRSTVLKVAHHGSDGSTTQAFVEAVDPEVAVISTGAENTFGHPSPTTRLRLAGVPLLRTDENGDVRFETDGMSLWVAFARGGYSLVPAGAAR